MKIVRTWFVKIAVVVWSAFLLPFAAPANTTQPATSLTTVEQGVFAYDAGTVYVVSDNTLAGSEACGPSIPASAPVAGLVAAKSEIPAVSKVGGRAPEFMGGKVSESGFHVPRLSSESFKAFIEVTLRASPQPENSGPTSTP